jgi:hypothetical protein
MSRALSLFLAAFFPASPASSPAARSAMMAPEVEGPMEPVGKTFLFDYGNLQIRVRYLSESKLEWEQVQGPSVGLSAQEEYGFTVVRPGLYFIWWQEEDTSIVTQVADFEKGRVYTTWTSPEKKLAAFEGMIRSTG